MINNDYWCRKIIFLLQLEVNLVFVNKGEQAAKASLQKANLTE